MRKEKNITLTESQFKQLLQENQGESLNKKMSKSTGIDEQSITNIEFILGAFAFGVACRKLGEI